MLPISLMDYSFVEVGLVLCKFAMSLLHCISHSKQPSLQAFGKSVVGNPSFRGQINVTDHGGFDLDVLTGGFVLGPRWTFSPRIRWTQSFGA